VATAALIELRDDRAVYLVPPTVAQDLVGEFSPCRLFTTMDQEAAATKSA
jgi:hypothetical protein